MHRTPYPSPLGGHRHDRGEVRPDWRDCLWPLSRSSNGSSNFGQGGAQRAAGEWNLEIIVAVTARILQRGRAGSVVGQARERRTGQRAFGLRRSPRFVRYAAKSDPRVLNMIFVVRDDGSDRNQVQDARVAFGGI